jgi:hypothetical protein
MAQFSQSIIDGLVKAYTERTLKENDYRQSIIDWDDLQTIAENADLLVSDADAEHEKTVGLLRQLMKEPEPRKNRSKFEQAMLLTHTRKERILRIVPKAEDLGDFREQRIGKLNKIVSLLPAFKWLKSLPAYSDVLSTLNHLASNQKKPIYASDLRQYTYISALAPPFINYCFHQLRGKELVFPKRENIRKASKAAKELTQFFSDFATPREVNMPMFDLRGSLQSLQIQLEKLGLSYATPRNTESLSQRLFCDDLIVSFLRVYGETSPSLVQKTCSLIEYEIDLSDLNKIIKEIKLREQRRPKLNPYTGIKS